MIKIKMVIINLLLFILLSTSLFAQEQADTFLNQAKGHMAVGRYGEAITLLNRYIALKPRDFTGYHQRALCYEQRTQYENAELDLERAIKLDPDNKQLRQDYARVREVWFALLDKKIEGHKREIAIDPSIPDNYVEIAKSYAWKEEWQKSEDWYDQFFIKEPNAAPDQVIRYTNVLTETKNLTKGEKKLLEYTERHPDDWRLWSRLGYFSLWLSKYKQAEEAFEKALAIKPFFKEAEEGLDLAKKEGYIFNYVELDNRKEKKPQEYAIDRYYKILKAKPYDDETRFKLIAELIPKDRLEEAYQQLLVLKDKYTGQQRFDEPWQLVTSTREKRYRSKIESAQARLEKDPLDKEAVMAVAQNYEFLDEYEEALSVLDYYFEERPDENDTDMLFLYAKLLAWYKDFDTSTQMMDKVVAAKPDNLDYLLFRGQLAVWNNTEPEMARKYLEQVYVKRPNSLPVLLTLSSLEMNEANYPQAEFYLNEAKKIDPLNDDVIKHASNLEFRKLRAEEERLFRVLEEGRKLAIDDEYEAAIPFYEQFLAEAEPNNLIYKEYGDIQFRAGNYDKALEVYNSLLAQDFNPDVAIQRGQVYFERDEPDKAIPDFEMVVKDDPDSFKKRLYLGDAYTKATKYSLAEAQYDTLENYFNPDSSQLAQLKLRRSWIPARGLNSMLYRFPSHVRLGPAAAFYSDDIGFKFSKIGSILELGVTDWLALGVSLYRTSLTSNVGSRYFNTFKGNIFLRLNEYISGGVGYGSVSSLGINPVTELEAFAEISKKDLYKIRGTYISTDAGIMLYSPSLVNIYDINNNRFMSTLYRVDGEYQHKSGIKLTGYFQYIEADNISNFDANVFTLTSADPAYGNNEGNTIMIRGGREFWTDLQAGYEYFYSNFRYISSFYYSPQGFESHSIWAEYILDKTEDYYLTVGGKLGYVPASSFIVRELYAKGEYKFLKNFIVFGRIGVGSTSRDDTSYNSVSGELSISWMIL